MSVTCPNCNAECWESDRFCPECGTPIDASRQEDGSSQYSGWPGAEQGGVDEFIPLQLPRELGPRAGPSRGRFLVGILLLILVAVAIVGVAALLVEDSDGLGASGGGDTSMRADESIGGTAGAAVLTATSPADANSTAEQEGVSGRDSAMTAESTGSTSTPDSTSLAASTSSTRGTPPAGGGSDDAEATSNGVAASIANALLPLLERSPEGSNAQATRVSFPGDGTGGVKLEPDGQQATVPFIDVPNPPIPSEPAEE